MNAVPEPTEIVKTLEVLAGQFQAAVEALLAAHGIPEASQTIEDLIKLHVTILAQHPEIIETPHIHDPAWLRHVADEISWEISQVEACTNSASKRN